MAIDTTNKKLSLISLLQPYNSPIPIPTGDSVLDSNDKKHLIWSYSGISWEGAAEITTNLLALENFTFSRIFSRIFGRIN